MAYQWTYGLIGGARRVKISSLEDIQHLEELDPKEWTVLGCPTSGLEIPEEVLQMMDYDGDGHIRIPEVVRTAKMLCEKLPHPERMLEPDHAALESEIAELEQKIAATRPELKAMPVAPYDAGVMQAWAEKKDAYDGYFRAAALEQMGLGQSDPEQKPGISEQEWKTMSEKIEEYEKEKVAAEQANAVATEEATKQMKEERKMLLLERWFVELLHNYVSLSDFYSHKDAIFQCGRLVIDQRECRLCIRVAPGAPMTTEAGKSDMYLVMCHCENKHAGRQMDIVAAMTAGDVNHLFEGKNGIFYDRTGLDYDAKITKIIDNPISLKQAFWAPYRKLAKWINEMIGKTADEKKALTDTNMQHETLAVVPGTGQKSNFDIAKFAGIFAAIGLAVGAIGGFLASTVNTLADLAKAGWWMPLIAIVGLMLCISLPSVISAYIKMRHRDLGPILNANGWAVNAECIVNIIFGRQLTRCVGEK